MKIFLDSDVLIDFLTAREPFLYEIKVIINKGVNKEIDLFSSSLIIANIHYFISKLENSKQAINKITKLTKFIKILNVGESEILESLKSKFKDFEDSIQNSCATKAKMDIIVTRNIKDFKHSLLPILTPKEFLKKLENE
ncbi:MAG: PIN domain-containing protein [Saprospiraceae bacterium]